MARPQRPLTPDLMTEEIRFLLKTLLRDDLFGEDVSLPEAEKLLESSLSVGFIEYCAFLKRHAYVDIDRAKNTIVVLPRGKNLADGGADPSLQPTVAAHFSKHLDPAAVAAAGRVIVALPAIASPVPVSSPPVSGPGSTPSGEVRRPAATAGAIVAPPGAGITGAGGSEERYSRGELLGQGTLGDVFRGFDTVLQRTVIIKDVRHVYDLVTYVPREEISRRVRSAALAQAKLLHPHVLRVVDLTGESIIVDDATGGSLRSRMARGPLPVDFVVRVVLQASYALHFAHKNDVVHGSIKPENVLFDAFGNVKLADFGVARVAERSADGPQTSAPPVYVGRGSPSYMAPEQLHQSQVGKPADVYALGILLYELLTGTLPGRRSPMPSSQARVVEALGKDGAAKIDDLFDKMTRDPLKERFADFDEVLKALVPALPKSEPARGTLYLYEVDPLPPPASPAGPSDDMIIPVTGSSVIISSVENTGS